MILEPHVIVLYVDDLTKTSQFYQDLLGIKSVDASPTFHSFTLSNGMNVALKAKHSVVPTSEEKNGNGELAFTVASDEQVDAIFASWKAKEVKIIFSPTQLPFGYTFVALDPDGNRLRVICLRQVIETNTLPTVEYLESFSVTGFSERTQNKDEFDVNTAKLPSLWQKFYGSELATNTTIYGVYANYDSDANGFYTVTVGVKCAQGQNELVKIQAGNYLVFQGTGPMPTAVIETWQRVWGFFETNTEYKRNFKSDFEAYNGSDKVTIYIGLS